MERFFDFLTVIFLAFEYGALDGIDPTVEICFSNIKKRHFF